jgi:hypothetical protein
MCHFKCYYRRNLQLRVTIIKSISAKLAPVPRQWFAIFTLQPVRPCAVLSHSENITFRVAVRGCGGEKETNWPLGIP